MTDGTASPTGRARPARPPTCRSTRISTRPARRTRTSRSRPTRGWPSSTGSPSSRSPTTSTSTRADRRTPSRRSRIASAKSVRRRSAGRARGAIRFGVEVTYLRRYEGEIRAYLRRHPYDFVIGSVHIGPEDPYTIDRVASFVAGRSLPEIVRPYFDEVLAGARSGLFDTLGHLDFVKRYLHPHVSRPTSPQPRSCTSRSCVPSSSPARRWRSTRPGCARRRRRPTRRRRSCGGSASWAGATSRRAPTRISRATSPSAWTGVRPRTRRGVRQPGVPARRGPRGRRGAHGQRS